MEIVSASNEPHWIDLQINGYAGVDFNARGLTVEKVKAVTRRLAADGTAGYLPTLVTGDPDMLVETIRTVVKARREDGECERRILGFFLEGPFISAEPGAVGTHPVEWVHAPDMALFNRFQDAAEGLIRIVNVAAEVPGMPEFAREIAASGVTVSLGHQLAHTREELDRLAEAGAKALTHLGNGLPNLVHRRENIMWEGLADDRFTVMFIPDGHHLTDAMLKVYTRGVPLKRLVAVSDAQYPAGMPPGEYEVCGAHARLEPSGLLWNPARNCLVGATTPMGRMMTYLQEKIGLTPAECEAIGRENPLRLIARG